MSIEHYQHEAIVNGIEIVYDYEIWSGTPLSKKLALTYNGFTLRVIYFFEGVTPEVKAHILEFDVENIKEAMYILNNIDISNELDKCKVCEPFRLYLTDFEDGIQDERVNGLYSRIPDQKYDGVGVQYYINIEKRVYDDSFELVEEKEMIVIFDKDGNILETRIPYDTKVDIKLAISKFLNYLKEKAL